jgi:phospholipid transport system substrate-binding protein
MILTITPAVTKAGGAGAEPAKALVQSIKDDFLSVVNNASLDDVAKQKKIEKIFVNVVDIEWLGKFAIGRNGKALTPEQLQQYNTAYKHYLVNSYVPKFRKYGGQALTIKGVTTSGDKQYIVHSEVINKAGSPPFEIDWNIIAKDNNQYLIYDMVTEGISLAATQRTEFGNIIANKGFSYLLERLNDK